MISNHPTSTSGGPPPAAIGPFGTAWEASQAIQAQARGPEAAPGILSDEERVHAIVSALDGAGVVLGDWDRGVAVWLAGLDDSTVAAVAGWITRAHAAGAGLALGADVLDAVQRGLAEAAAAREERAALPCDACDSSPAGLCDSHWEDLDAAEAYRAAARELAGGAR